MIMASPAMSGHSAQAAKGKWWRCRVLEHQPYSSLRCKKETTLTSSQ
uniref:Alternative protein KIAA0319L n=1 Tax=Homo sapiens TaxID=9606 RepID=L8EB66_HUMAN|nr:alternative protein KIAA0319L [Homo sapiens]